MANPSTNSMSSFSGADIVATFGGEVVAELQQITWAIKNKDSLNLWVALKPC